jgi:hypothetical protein
LRGNRVDELGAFGIKEKLYFIPCITQGGKGAVFEGVYDAITVEINKMSKEMFK